MSNQPASSRPLSNLLQPVIQHQTNITKPNIPSRKNQSFTPTTTIKTNSTPAIPARKFAESFTHSSLHQVTTHQSLNSKKRNDFNSMSIGGEVSPTSLVNSQQNNSLLNNLSINPQPTNPFLQDVEVKIQNRQLTKNFSQAGEEWLNGITEGM